MHFVKNCCIKNVIRFDESLSNQKEYKSLLVKIIGELSATRFLLHFLYPKGDIISKCLFGVFKFFQKTNENKSIRDIIAVKSIFFRLFFGRIK